MAWSRAFQKCIIFHFWTNFFCKHFYYITGFRDKKFNFCKFCNFFADSQSRAQELSNDLSFVIFGHQTWDLEHILVFKYPSIDRVNLSIYIYKVIISVCLSVYLSHWNFFGLAIPS